MDWIVPQLYERTCLPQPLRCFFFQQQLRDIMFSRTDLEKDPMPTLILIRLSIIFFRLFLLNLLSLEEKLFKIFEVDSKWITITSELIQLLTTSSLWFYQEMTQLLTTLILMIKLNYYCDQWFIFSLKKLIWFIGCGYSLA